MTKLVAVVDPKTKEKKKAKFAKSGEKSCRGRGAVGCAVCCAVCCAPGHPSPAAAACRTSGGAPGAARN